MSGVFDPRVWTDGDDAVNTPTADDLNVEWRDSLNFLMGTTRPMIFVYSTTGTTITTSETFVPFNNEKVKRGNMLHSNSVSNTDITIPFNGGQYTGFVWGGFQTLSTLSSRLIVRVKVNGNNMAIMSMKPEFSGGWNIHGSLTLDVDYNDVITMTMQTTSGTAVMGNTLLAAPRLALWYSGDWAG
jgi:hypothetical protein